MTGGNDKSLKLWQLGIEDKIVRLLYIVRLDEPIVCMALYSMDQYRGCVVPFVDSQHFYVIKFNEALATA